MIVQNRYDENREINSLTYILDFYGREIAGWTMSDRINKELVITALQQARDRCRNPKGVLAHSDKGSVYCSNEYQRMLAKDGYVCSMSRKGNCWDNSPMESF